MNLKDLTPKKILLDSIKSKLDGTGITKIIIMFCLPDDKYNVMFSSAEGKNLKADISEDEINALKKIFIRRIIVKWYEKYDIEPKNVIIQLNVVESLLEIFIQDDSGKTYKFDF